MVKHLTLVLASLGLAACVANDPPTSSSSNSSLISSSQSSVGSSVAVSSSSTQPVSSSLSSMPASSSVTSSDASTGTHSSAAVNMAEGKQLYEIHCLECHGVIGAGSIKIPVPIKDVSYAGLMAKVDGGNMPTGTGPLNNVEYSPEQCVGECADKVARYITSGFPGALESGAGKELGFNGCSEAEGAPASRALRLLTRREYENSINDIFGLNLELTTNFPPEGRDHGFTNNADIAQVTALHLDNYYDAASRVTAEVQNRLNSGLIRDTLNCSANYHCIRTFVEKFGAQIFRRPLQGQEIDEYMAFFTVLRPAGQDDNFFNHSDRFKEAIGVGLPSLLMSPHFLYRKELGAKDGALYRLDDYEMATLIAYTFTGSTPDAELSQAARNQQVRTKAQFKAQAERLIATERGKAQMAHFAVEWWDAGLELIGSKNPDFYQGYGPDVIQSMVGEMEAFFKHVVFESTGKFSELYQPGYTMLNNTLADFYGIGGVTSASFTKVTNNQRGGILSFGGIMASNASTEESSPVKRGVFVREQLMCDPLPPLPRDVNIPNPDLDPTKPMRQRFEAHSVNPNCWACHKFFDDIGYAMEIYDASGKYRDTEKMYDWATHELIRELDIITTGKVINVDGQDEHFFDDLSGLSSIMAQADSTKSCMTTQYYRYVMGYKLHEADQCAISNLNKIFADNEFDIQSLLLGITQLDSFSLRQ